MKIFIFLLMVISFHLKSQNLADDLVDFNRFDTAFFAKCFTELCNNERISEGGKILNLSNFGIEAAQFQSDYNSETCILEHTQSVPFKGLTLKTPQNRLEYFSKGENLTCFGEIISKSGFSNSMTYNFLAKKIFRMYFMSEGHRKTILSNLNKNVNISSGINISKQDGSIIFHTCFIFFE
jgi:uncharacterized protein YkwD